MGLSSYEARFATALGTRFLLADGTSSKAITSAAASQPTVVSAILVTSDSASAHDLNLLYSFSTEYQLVRVTIPAGAGYLTAPPVDLLASLPTNLQEILLTPGGTLKASLVVALSGVEKIDVFVKAAIV